MVRAKLYIGLVIFSLVALLAGACASGAPDLEVRDAADARDAVLTYLTEHEGENAPSQGIEWQAEDITPPGLVGVGMKEFTSDEWTIKVSYAVLPPEDTMYQLVVSSIKLGWHWKGSVKTDGNVTEASAFKQMSETESRNLAEEFVRNSPTSAFDGITDTFRLADTLTARCPYCWVFIFEFDSAHAGYGDRTGQALAEVITHHKASIAVEQLEITSAVMDNKWDMISQQMIAEQENAEGTLSVAELLANPLYDTEVRIYGQVSLLGELFCPCFELASGAETVEVWYDLMVEDDEIQRPPVSVEGIENGDWVIVTGELRPSDGQLPSTTFWASNIEESVDASFAGKEVEVAVGGSLIVTLESNPTTGFKWELTEVADRTVLELVESKYEPGKEARQEPPVPGAGGTEIWSFRTLKKGETTISMEYSQPWEGGAEAAKTFNLTVVVE